ncbi:unnamed protein product [Brugia timori]|uniref:Tyrosine-protein kinase n=1 Tax=Brugia timori TaxID=42155 RepID=A0A0R3QMK7_9BILA|nr:unnamed protein product [Brugia timori]
MKEKPNNYSNVTFLKLYIEINIINLFLQAFRTGGLLTGLLHLSTLAVYHLVSITHPFDHGKLLNQHRTRLIVILIWSLPPLLLLLYFSVWPDQGYRIKNCSVVEFYDMLYFRMIISILIVVLMLCTGLMYWKLLRRLNESFSKSTTTIRKQRIVVASGLIFGTFVIGWLPASLLYILTAQDMPLYHVKSIWLNLFALTTLILIMIKSITNPIIYATRIPEIRHLIDEWRNHVRIGRNRIKNDKRNCDEHETSFCKIGYGLTRANYRRGNDLVNLNGKLMAEKSSKAIHSADDIPKGLEDEKYFHGLLPREDCNEILTKVGDFLVRVSQPRPTDPREVIISVRVSKGQSGHSIRHIIVKKQKLPNGQIAWIAIEAIKFTSFFELIDHYVKRGDPINPELENSVLIKAINRQPWEFSHDDVTLNKMLGSGAFGEVRSGVLTIKKKKIECAVKIAKLTVTEAQMAFRKEKIKEMMHEARLMRHYDHDNIVRIYGVAVDREPLMIVIELIKGGCLSDDLRQRKGNITDDEKVEKMCLGAAYGLQYLHSKKCIHRDIAARNILYTKDKVAKISDFGMSREGTIYKMKTSKKVPIKWTAPETIATFVYSLKTDVYSFSIMICEIFTDGEEPYKGLTNSEVKKMVLRGERMEIPEAPDGISSLIRHCWDQNASSRWTMKTAVKKLERIAKQINPQGLQLDNVTAIALDSGKDMSSSKKAINSIKKSSSLKSIPDSPTVQQLVSTPN